MPLTRRFLPAESRASLFATGKATVRTRVDHHSPIYQDCETGVWNQVWFTLDSVRDPTIEHVEPLRCPTPPGAEYWVPETWGTSTRPDQNEGWRDGIEYKADETGDDRDLLPLYGVEVPDGIDLESYDGGVWYSPAQMPRFAARLFVRVATVRVAQRRAERPLGEWQFEWAWEIDLERKENGTKQ